MQKITGIDIQKHDKSNRIIKINLENDIIDKLIFPFNKFDGVDLILGPEMKSTGEVMGIDESFLSSYIKSQIACGNILPSKGNVFISKRNVINLNENLHGSPKSFSFENSHTDKTPLFFR